jgi:hypothetical protein
MNPNALKTFLRFLLLLAMRVPFALAGTWLVNHGITSPAEWALVVDGLSVLLLTLLWAYLEQSPLLKRLQGDLTPEEIKRLTEIGIALPHGSSVEDALAIFHNERNSR